MTEWAESDAAVVVKDLTVKFGEFYAVKNISFSVKKGEIFGFLGANGAGKTTTIRVLCGLLRPTSGDARVAGIGFETGEMAIKQKVGYMSQKFTLYNDLTIEENFSFSASLRKMEKSVFLERRDSILKFISFKKPLNSFVRDLPGGIKQQVSLAAAILHDPEIIFLDEPTAGVTPVARARFWALIRRLAGEGKTIFVTTHYMDEAEQCERIALMRTGEIIALDSPENLKKSIFPEPVYELDSTSEDGKTNYSEMLELRSHPEIRFFEPYGLRFHACFVNSEAGEKLKATLSKKYKIQQIKATLEDVFIRCVEGKSL